MPGTFYVPLQSELKVDSNVSPDTSPNFSYNGGHIISHVQIVAVYWGAGVDSQVQEQWRRRFSRH